MRRAAVGLRRALGAIGVCSLLVLPAAASARWFKPPCPRGPDGRCIEVPCEPFLEKIRILAIHRRRADDPGCPWQAQASRLAERQQAIVDQEKGKMSTACIRKTAALMRPVASIDVLRSYRDANGSAVALVRYTNNAHRTVQDATITCSAMRDLTVIATGTGVAAGPIPADASRELPVRIPLGGAAFSCAQCELTLER
jgi:hypothetical protein